MLSHLRVWGKRFFFVVFLFFLVPPWILQSRWVPHLPYTSPSPGNTLKCFFRQVFSTYIPKKFIEWLLCANHDAHLANKMMSKNGANFAFMELMEYPTHSWKALLYSKWLSVTHSFVINRKIRWQTEPCNGSLMEPWVFVFLLNFITSEYCLQIEIRKHSKRYLMCCSKLLSFSPFLSLVFQPGIHYCNWGHPTLLFSFIRCWAWIWGWSDFSLGVIKNNWYHKVRVCLPAWPSANWVTLESLLNIYLCATDSLLVEGRW